MSAQPENIVLILPAGLENDLLVLANIAAQAKGLLDTGNGTGRDYAGAASQIKNIILSQAKPQYEKAERDALKKQVEEELKPKDEPKKEEGV
jgi:hypothetical protein